MADQLCDHCREEPAVFLFGPIASGASWFGAGCMARAGLELAQAVLDAEEIAQTLGPMFVEVPRPRGQEPKRSRGKRAKQEAQAEEPEPEPTPAEVVEETPAAADHA